MRPTGWFSGENIIPLSSPCSFRLFHRSRLLRRISFRLPTQIEGKRDTFVTFPLITLYTCAFEHRSSEATSSAVRISLSSVNMFIILSQDRVKLKRTRCPCRSMKATGTYLALHL